MKTEQQCTLCQGGPLQSSPPDKILSHLRENPDCLHLLIDHTELVTTIFNCFCFISASHLESWST
jgi:hypothetical protein